MSSSTSTLVSADSVIAMLTGIFTDGAFGAIAQELLILLAFALSFLIWRDFNRGNRSKRRAPKTVEDVCAPSVKLLEQDDTIVKSPAKDTDQEALASIAEKQLLKHLANHQFTRALNMYRALERDGRDRGFSEELYSNFIQSAIRVGKVDVVERMLKATKHGKTPPSLKFWQTTLKMLSSRKHYASCIMVYQNFSSFLPVDKVIYSCMINAALEVGAPEKAIAMLPGYSQASIYDKDYVLFFRIYVALGDVDAAEEVFRTLGNKCTPLMLNLVLLTCINTDQVDRGLKLLQEVHELETGYAEPIVDVVSYNTIIKGFAAAKKPRRCFECLHQLMEKGMQPDEITMGTLLDACIIDTDSQSASEMVKLLMGSCQPVMDTVMCTLFMKGLVRAGCVSHAMDLYDEMKRRQIAVPDLVTYSVLIKALVDQHDLTHALSLVDDMRAAGFSPDDIIVTHLLEGCRYANNHSLGKKIFQNMLTAGIKPSEYTLVTMLKLHGRCGALKEAYELVSTWESKHGSKPSVIHYTCLMSGCLRAKHYDQAWSAYELMLESGISPDQTALSTLITGMSTAQMWDRVLAVSKTALKANLPSRMEETFNSALGQMLMHNGQRPKADQLQEMMTAAGVSIAIQNMRRLV